MDAGFGETKPCNTTGTSTNDGYTEPSFTWKVANYLRPMLESQGITVVMTRDSDDGVGPCVNKRAADRQLRPAPTWWSRSTVTATTRPPRVST